MLLMFSTEPMHVVADELDNLINTYWYATPENAGHVPLNFNWPLYHKLDDLGVLKIYCARNLRDELIGAALYNIVEAPHHKGFVVAECDTLCTARKARGAGVASRLMAYVEQELKAAGVKEYYNRARHCYDTEPLFPKLGFDAIETVYRKRIV